jgi:hypothetical protein
MFMEEDTPAEIGGHPALACRVCGALGPEHACSGCHSVIYGSEICQKSDWEAKHVHECEQMRWEGGMIKVCCQERTREPNGRTSEQKMKAIRRRRGLYARMSNRSTKSGIPIALEPFFVYRSQDARPTKNRHLVPSLPAPKKSSLVILKRICFRLRRSLLL